MTRAAYVAFAAAVLLVGCTNSNQKTAVCPMASLLPEANRVTVYRDGPGRDISDIVYEARLIALDGDCSYDILKKDKDLAKQTYKGVRVNLRPRFIVTPGPAMTGYRVPVNYFVAIPEFYPRPEGRAEFTREVETSPARTQVDVTEGNIEIYIPLNETRRGESLDLYVGFVLSEEQLRENRGRSGGRLDR